MKYWGRVQGNRWLVAKMFGVLMICESHPYPPVARRWRFADLVDSLPPLGSHCRLAFLQGPVSVQQHLASSVLLCRFENLSCVARLAARSALAWRFFGNIPRHWVGKVCRFAEGDIYNYTELIHQMTRACASKRAITRPLTSASSKTLISSAQLTIPGFIGEGQFGSITPPLSSPRYTGWQWRSLSCDLSCWKTKDISSHSSCSSAGRSTVRGVPADFSVSTAESRAIRPA